MAGASVGGGRSARRWVAAAGASVGGGRRPGRARGGRRRVAAAGGASVGGGGRERESARTRLGNRWRGKDKKEREGVGGSKAVGLFSIQRFKAAIRVKHLLANQNAPFLCRVLRFGTRQRIFPFFYLFFLFFDSLIFFNLFVSYLFLYFLFLFLYI